MKTLCLFLITALIACSSSESPEKKRERLQSEIKTLSESISLVKGKIKERYVSTTDSIHLANPGMDIEREFQVGDSLVAKDAEYQTWQGQLKSLQEEHKGKETELLNIKGSD